MNQENNYEEETSVVILSEYIEQLLTEKPNGKTQKKLYNEWKTEVNKYIKKCNSLAKHNIYKLL